MRNGVRRKRKRTQYWFSIRLTREDVCGLNAWHTWKMTMVMLTLALCALKLVMIPSDHHRHFRPTHTPRWSASTPPIRESNGSDVQQPSSSDFACWIRAYNVPTQLNRPNRNVPDLVSSDVQRLGRCVPAFRASSFIIRSLVGNIEDWNCQNQTKIKELINGSTNKWICFLKMILNWIIYFCTDNNDLSSCLILHVSCWFLHLFLNFSPPDFSPESF